MKNFKKVLSLALALLMVVGCMVVAPVETKAEDTYTKVTSANDITDGYYVIVAASKKESGKSYAMRYDLNTSSGYLGAVEVTVSGNSITAPGGHVPVWKITPSNGSFTIQGKDQYLSYKSSRKVEYSENSKIWDFTSTGEMFKIVSTADATNGNLAYNSDAYRFKPYATSYTAGVYDFTIYKYNGTSVTYPTNIADLGSSATPEQIVNAAYTAMYNAVKLEGTYTLTGVVNKVDGDNIYMTIGNMSDKPINCYKLNLNSKTEAVAVGDTLTVSGTLGYYNVTPQFATGCTLENYTAAGSGSGSGDGDGSGNGGGETTTPTDLDVPANATQKEIVELAYTLADGRKLKEQVTLTGVIKEISDLDTNYNSRTATIVVGGLTEKPILCYGMKSILGATEEGLAALNALKVGDTIDVTGTIKRYGEDVEFYLPTFVMEGEEAPEVPVVPEGATDAQIVDIAYTLLSGQTLEKEVTLTGVISEFKYPYKEGYDNIAAWIVVDGKEDKPILCYGLKGEGIETVAVGDTITVKGYLTNYNGTTIEFNGSTLVSFVDTGDYVLPVFVVLFAGCALVAVGFVGRRKMA